MRMSEAHSGQHDHGIQQGTAHKPSPFTEAELLEFHKSDVQAGGAVVKLMAAIFLIGVFLYALVNYAVAN
jgi:hypothetical protein